MFDWHALLCSNNNITRCFIHVGTRDSKARRLQQSQGAIQYLLYCNIASIVGAVIGYIGLVVVLPKQVRCSCCCRCCCSRCICSCRCMELLFLLHFTLHNYRLILLSLPVQCGVYINLYRHWNNSPWSSTSIAEAFCVQLSNFVRYSTPHVWSLFACGLCYPMYIQLFLRHNIFVCQKVKTIWSWILTFL